jgi:hypothetical protein
MWNHRPSLCIESLVEGSALTVGIRIKLAGVTQEQFDRVNARIHADSEPIEGLVFHASGPIDGGWGALDFWESRAHFDAFSTRIGAAVAAEGLEMQAPPDIKEFPVHETFRP